MGVEIRSRRGSTFPGQSIYAASETANAALGEFFILGDRVFRYCKAGASNLTAGYMTAGPVEVANYKEQVQTAYGMTAGQKVVNVLLGAAPAADALKDGWLVVNKGTGLGQMYKIKSNTNASAPCVVTLYDEIITTVPATSEVSIILSQWNGVLVAPTTATSKPAGVPLVDVTAAYYFWAQVKGPTPMYVDAGDTIVIGVQVGKPTTNGTAGAVGTLAADTDPIYGVCLYAAVAGEVACIDLNLE